jgi:hypothetical protein
MPEDKEIQKAVGRYLEKVAVELTNVPHDERDAILESVESHIYEALERRSPGAATMSDLAFVFAEMASPSSYAQPAKVTPAPCPPPPAPASAPLQVQPREPRLCWYPVVGLILTPFAIVLAAMVTSIVLAMFLPAANMHRGSTPVFSPLLIAVAAIVLPLPVISTMLGFVGISRIRASHGGLYGMPLAVAVSLIFPLVVFNVLTVGAAVLSVRGLQTLVSFPKPLFLLELALIVLANVVVCRRVWRWANRPASQGQPA